MKKLFFLSCLLLPPLFGYSQSLIMKGRIKCENESALSSKGAENIVVVPAFMPSRSTITLSRPTGYFEFNTGIPIQKVQDKTITVYIISRCTNCSQVAKRVFISEDQDRQNAGDDKKYVTIKDWMLNTNCRQVELRPLAADSILSAVSGQPGQDLDKMTAASALAGTPAFLNFLTTITNVAGVLPNAGAFTISALHPGKINYGQFLMASPLYHSANTGFNFSPSRDMSEAAFWNPSAIAFSRKANNISLLTNLKNNIKLAGFFTPRNNLAISIGGMYTAQDERRKADFQKAPDDPNNPPPDPFILTVDSTIMKLKAFAAYAGVAYKVAPNLSVGLTVKSIWQNFNTPDSLFINGEGRSQFFDQNIKTQHFDVDISATYKITNSLQAGINFMNLAGTKLYADAFVRRQTNIPIQQQRSLGIGLTYKWQRFNFGADALFTKNGLYDAALGVNCVPFNNALISAGFSIKQLSYSLAFRLKHFRLGYINDNNWLVNQKRTGKADILNGRLFGGFIFDFD